MVDVSTNARMASAETDISMERVYLGHSVHATRGPRGVKVGPLPLCSLAADIEAPTEAKASLWSLWSLWPHASESSTACSSGISHHMVTCHWASARVTVSTPLGLVPCRALTLGQITDCNDSQPVISTLPLQSHNRILPLDPELIDGDTPRTSTITSN